MDARLRRVVPFALLACGAGLLGAQAGEDPWRSGCRLESWGRIERIQRYPLFDPQAPDWAALCKDADPVVRAAAALGVGRTADARLVALVVPLIDDPSPLARECALWAALQMDSPAVIDPVLKVVATWQKLEGGMAVCDPYLIARIGLPFDLAREPLRVRAEWVRKLDPSMCMPVRPERPDWQPQVAMCAGKSQMDSGDSLHVRLLVTVRLREGERLSTRQLLDSCGYWCPLNPGPRGERELYNQRLFFPRDLEGGAEPRELASPDAMHHTFEAVISTSRKPVPPDVYVFRAFGASPPLLLRVTRSAEMEKRVAELAAKPDNAKLLGEQRVAAAVPALIEQFRKNAGKNNFAVAGALARIGDPAAIPVLLEHPFMRDDDVIGDASGAVALFGEAARAHCEKRVVAWKDALAQGDEGVARLMACLHVLGPNASGEAEKALLDLIEHLSKKTALSDRGWELYLLATALCAVAPRSPDKVVEVIWGMRGRPAGQALVANLRSMDDDALLPIATALWRRVKQEDRETYDFQRSLLDVMQYHRISRIVLEDDAPILTEREAEVALDAALNERSHGARTLERVSKLLDANKGPLVRIKLGQLCLDMNRMAEAEKLLAACLPELKEDWQKIQGSYYLAQALSAQGKRAEATKLLKEALALAQPHTVYGGVRTDLQRESIEKALQSLSAVSADSPIRFRRLSGGMERFAVAEKRIWQLDRLNRLCAWDPFGEERSVAAVMPRPVLDFVALDRSCVFVAFAGGMVALYQEGNDAAIWKRPLSLGFQSFLSVSPKLITLGDEEGTLHALDPTTGRTLWSRKGNPSPRRRDYRPHVPGCVGQHGDTLLLPDRALEPSELECIESGTGQRRWAYRPPFTTAKVAFAKGLVFLAGGRGQIEAVSLADGTRKWEKDFETPEAVLGRRIALAAAGDGSRVYLAANATVHALAVATGEELWSYTWAPKPKGEKARLDLPDSVFVWPAAGVTYFVADWEADVEEHRERTDVVLLDDKGKALAHETAPHEQGWPRWVKDAFVDGRSLVVRREAAWEVWEVGDLKAGEAP